MSQKFYWFSQKQFLIIFLISSSLLLSCQTTKINPNSPIGYRRQKIDQESLMPGYFIGRRYYLPKTRLWGYIRKPRQYWNKQAKLVVMNEKFIDTPDRVIEGTIIPHAYGYDHNYEYLIKGYYSGEKVYAPNSNRIIDEFIPHKFILINKKPGFLFQPNEKYHPKKLPHNTIR